MNVRIGLSCLLLGLVVFALGCNSGQKQEPGHDRSSEALTGAQPRQFELTLAVIKKDISRAKQLLDQGADIDEDSGDEGTMITPLLFAITNNDNDMTQLLLRRGANKTFLYQGYFPKELAIHKGMNETTLHLFKSSN